MGGEGGVGNDKLWGGQAGAGAVGVIHDFL